MNDAAGTAAAAYDLSGSTALVTGGAGDIGRAVAVRLSASGARVALSDLAAASDGLEETRQACAELAGVTSVAVAPADVTDPTELEARLTEVAERVGTPDLVFNNAGYQGAFFAAPDYPSDDFSLVMSVNVSGVFNVLRMCARRLRAEGRGGSIVNSASMAGVEGAPNMIAYSASKGAVISLTRTAAKDLAPLGIRVNAVSPAFIGPGRMWERQVRLQAQSNSRFYSADPEEVASEMICQVPMARYGSLDEVAAAVTWLLSSEASYITGQNIHITGGL